jgi:MYXO-CTERM domain-containing protein
MIKTTLTTLTAVAAIAIATQAHAAPIVPASYAYNTTIDHGVNLDASFTTLKDNVIGVGSWGDGHYVGFGDAASNAWASVTFTFDNVYDFQTIDPYTYSGFNAGYVEVSTSLDNLTFTSPTQYILTNAAVGPPSSAVTDSLDVSALPDAQYVKIEWFKTDTNPGTGNWVFISEVDFEGQTAAVPEPASVAMGLMGLTLIAARRRR